MNPEPDTSQTMSVGADRLTEKALGEVDQEVLFDVAWYQKILNFAATPFSYETGFYFKGNKTYQCKPLGLLSICGCLFLLISFLVLIGPVLI